MDVQLWLDAHWEAGGSEGALTESLATNLPAFPLMQIISSLLGSGVIHLRE